jgi:hypothetical protein
MRIAYTRPEDGRVLVVDGASIPALKKNPKNEFLTDDEYKNLIWADVPDDAISPVEIPESLDLTYREFRNAWKQDGNNITHDLEKVKDIQIERTESALKPIMQALSENLLEAIISGNNGEQASIMAKKDRLRNDVNALKALVPQSIEQIKAATPILGGI